MPTLLLTCAGCHGRRPFLVEGDLVAALENGGSASMPCGVCRTSTDWALDSPERRAGDDRRSGEDRRAQAETLYARLSTDGSVDSGIDKRAFPRYESPANAYVLYPEGSGHLRDLSLGGLFIPDRRPLRIDTEISLELRLGGPPMFVRGVVRRSVIGEGMGIEFVDMSAEDKRRLKVFLAGLAAPGEQKKPPQ